MSTLGGIKNSMSIASLASSVQALEASDFKEKSADEQSATLLKKSDSQESHQARFKRRTKPKGSEADLSVERALSVKRELQNRSQILNQDLLSSLQPSSSALRALITKQSEKIRENQQKLDKQIDFAVLNSDDSDDELRKSQKIKTAQQKIAADREALESSMIQIDDSIASSLLLQSIEKAKQTKLRPMHHLQTSSKKLSPANSALKPPPGN